MENRVEAKENVVSIFSAQNAKAEPRAADEEKCQEEADFETIMKRNKEAKERMRQERLKSNRSVLRSYRIKS